MVWTKPQSISSSAAPAASWSLGSRCFVVQILLITVVSSPRGTMTPLAATELKEWWILDVLSALTAPRGQKVHFAFIFLAIFPFLFSVGPEQQTASTQSRYDSVKVDTWITGEDLALLWSPPSWGKRLLEMNILPCLLSVFYLSISGNLLLLSSKTL